MKTKDINIAIASEIAIEAFENLQTRHKSIRKEFPTLDCQQFKFENYLSCINVYVKSDEKINKIVIMFDIGSNEKFKNEFYRITQNYFFIWLNRTLAPKIERKYDNIDLFIGNSANENDLIRAAEHTNNFAKPIIIHRIKINTNKKINIL